MGSPGSGAELKEAFEIAQISNLDAIELENLEKREQVIHDSRNAIIKATKTGEAIGLRKGIKQGIELGMKEGMKEGMEEGMEAGDRQARLAIARKLLTTTALETISQITELTLEELQELDS